jgi:hypothetical protein
VPAVVSSLALIGACLAVLAWSAGRLAAAGRRTRSTSVAAARDAATRLEAARGELDAQLEQAAATDGGRDGDLTAPR